MIENLPILFGYKCDVFAKMLYIRMANGMDFAKIDFMRYIKCFDGFLDEISKKRNEAIFKFYDIKKQGFLDIMSLMSMFNNVDRDSNFAQELLIFIREYKLKNVLLISGYARQITLNFPTFNDLLQTYSSNTNHHSYLIDEIQYIIIGK